MSDPVFYRLLPGSHQPAFRLGETYRFLGGSNPEGYIELELDGKGRCVWAEHFERVYPKTLILFDQTEPTAEPE